MPFDQIFWNNYGSLPEIAEKGHYVASNVHDIRFGQTETEDSHSAFSFCGKRRIKLQDFYHMYFADDRNPYNYRNRDQFYKAKYDPNFTRIDANGDEVSAYDPDNKVATRWQLKFNTSYVFGWPKLEDDGSTTTDAYYGGDVKDITTDDISTVYGSKRDKNGTNEHSTLTDDLFQAQNRQSCHWLSNTALAKDVENPFMGIHKDNPLSVTADKNFLGYMLVLKRVRHHYNEAKVRLVHGGSHLAVDPRPFRQNKNIRKQVFLGAQNVYYEQFGDPFWNMNAYNFVQMPGWTWTVGVNRARRTSTLNNEKFRVAISDSDNGLYRDMNYDGAGNKIGSSWTPNWDTNVSCASIAKKQFDYINYVDSDGDQIYHPPDYKHPTYGQYYLNPGNYSACGEFKMVWAAEPRGCPGSVNNNDFSDMICTEFWWENTGTTATSEAWKNVQDQASNNGDLNSNSWINISNLETSIEQSAKFWAPPNVLFMYYPEQGGVPYQIVEKYTAAWWKNRGKFLMKKKVRYDMDNGEADWVQVGFGQPQVNWLWIYQVARAQNRRLGCYIKTGTGCDTWSAFNVKKAGTTKAFKTTAVHNNEYHDWMDGCFWTSDHWVFTKNKSADPAGWSNMKNSGKKTKVDKWFFRTNSNSAIDNPRTNYSGDGIDITIGRPPNAENSNAFSNIPGNYPFAAITDQYIESNGSTKFWDIDNYDHIDRSNADNQTRQMLWDRVPKIQNANFINLSETTKNSDIGNIPIVDINEIRSIESYSQPGNWNYNYPQAHPYGIYWNFFFLPEAGTTYPSIASEHFHEGETIRKHRWRLNNKHYSSLNAFWQKFVGVLGNTTDVYLHSPNSNMYWKERASFKDSYSVFEASIHGSYSKREQIDTGSVYFKNITIKKGSKVLPAKEDVLGEWVEQTSSEIYTDRTSKIVGSNSSTNRKIVSFKNMYKNKTNICKRYFDKSFQIKFGSNDTWHSISAVNNSSITLSTSPGTLSNSSFTLRIPRGSRDENYTWGNYKLSSFDGDTYSATECWPLRNSEDVTWADLFVSTFKTDIVEMKLPFMWDNGFYGLTGNAGKANRHPFFSNELSESLHIRNGFTNVAYWQDSYWNNRGGQFGHISAKVKGNVSWDACSWVKYWETAHTAYTTYTITHNGEVRNLSVDWDEWKGPNPPYSERYGVGEWSPPLLNANGDYSHVRPPATYDGTESSSAGWFSNVDNLIMDQGIAAPVRDYQGNGVNFRINTFLFGGLDKASGSLWPGYGYDQSVKLAQPALDTSIELRADWASMFVDAFGTRGVSGNVPLMPRLDKPWMSFCAFSRFSGLFAYYQYGIQQNWDYDILANNMNILENAGVEIPDSSNAAGNMWKDNDAGKTLRTKSFDDAEKSRLQKYLLHPWVLASYGYDNDHLGWGNKTGGQEPHFITIYDSNEYIKKGTTFTVSLHQGGTAFNRELLIPEYETYNELDEVLGMSRTTQDLDSYQLYLVAK